MSCCQQLFPIEELLYLGRRGWTGRSQRCIFAVGFFGVYSGGVECSHLNAMVTNAASKPVLDFSLELGQQRNQAELCAGKGLGGWWWGQRWVRLWPMARVLP